MLGRIVDTNIWLAAFFENHEGYEIATGFIASRTEADPALFCRATEQSWLRLATTPALHALYNTPRITNAEASAALANWRSQTNIRSIDAEPEGTRDCWLELAAIPSCSPKVWMDAYLAALAIRAGLPLVTFDSGFECYQSAGLTLQLLPK